MTTNQFLNRTPILNGQQRIIGYELGHGEGSVPITDLLVHALEDEEDGAALGKNPFFIPATLEFLESEAVGQLAPRNTICSRQSCRYRKSSSSLGCYT